MSPVAFDYCYSAAVSEESDFAVAEAELMRTFDSFDATRSKREMVKCTKFDTLHVYLLVHELVVGSCLLLRHHHSVLSLRHVMVHQRLRAQKINFGPDQHMAILKSISPG